MGEKVGDRGAVDAERNGSGVRRDGECQGLRMVRKTHHIVRQRSIIVVILIIEFRIADPRAASLLLSDRALPLFARR